MMAFFANNDYEVKTFGDGTRFFEPTIDVPTPQQDDNRKKIQAELDRLRERMKVSGPTFARAEVVWEQTMRLEGAASWRPLMPSTVDATNGVTLAIARNGSVMAGGANPGETILHDRGAGGTLEDHRPQARGPARCLAAQRRPGPRRLRQLPGERHSD